MDASYAAAVVGLETEPFLEKIRENVGLQNIGLLVLDSPNGSMKRDAWTSNFRDILFALNFPELVDKTPVVQDPDKLPGAFVHIPDANLRAAIAEALGKSPNAPITLREMERLRELRVADRDIRDLTGLQFATNMYRLHIGEGSRGNQVSDLSPIAGLINLERLYLASNPISDISLLKGLTNLKGLVLEGTLVSDLSPLTTLTNLDALWIGDTIISDLSPIAGLINLKSLQIFYTNVSDLSPIAGLINLEALDFGNSPASDLSPIAGLINLKHIVTWGSPISDLSPLAGLTKLEIISFKGAEISDLKPLVGLTGLKELHLKGNKVSDISPLAGLTELVHLDLGRNNISDISLLKGLINLKWLNVAENDISDVSPLAGLINLKWLGVYRNEISDISPLDGLRENITLLWHENPAFPKGGPSIEGPWLWVVLPYHAPSGSKDLLSEASGGTVTEIATATHGAIEGQAVGDDVWTSRRLPPTGWNNVDRMLGDRDDSFRLSNMLYGTVSLHSPREQNTTMYVGSHNGFQVWLNGDLIYESLRYHGSSDYTDFLPVTLQEGRNVLLVAVAANYNSFFGFEPGTEYTVANSSIGYTFSKIPIHTGDTFTLDIRAENVFDLAGWQFDVAFDRNALEAINVSEGDFLKKGVSTLFQSGSINNGAGKITGLTAVRLAQSGASGSGTVVQVSFKAKRGGETKLTLQNFQFATITGDSIPAGPHEITISIEGQLSAGDVNRDGQVTVADLILVAAQLGKRVPAGAAEDVNGDGIVNMLDLLVVAQAVDSSAAPLAVGTESVDAAMVEAWIAQARLEDDDSFAFKEGIENLERLLASLIPEETALLPNYPNPFNPETWIPYHLAEAADVKLTIYDTKGAVVRQFDLGHQRAGYYADRSKAVYWDGRNATGESVASGTYFYHLRAGEYSQTRRLVILK